MNYRTEPTAKYAGPRPTAPKINVDVLRQQAQERIWRLRGINPTERIVLLALARTVYRSTEEGWVCSPSLLTITDGSGASRSSVIRIIKKFDSVYLERRDPRRFGDTCTYVLFAKPRCQPDTSRGPQITRTDSVRVRPDQENFSSPVLNSHLKVQAAAPTAAAATQSPGAPSNEKRKTEADPFVEGISAALKTYSDLPPRLLLQIESFAATLRERGVSVAYLKSAIELAMERRRSRGARDVISSLRYFLPAVDEVVEQQRTGGAYGRREERGVGPIAGFTGNRSANTEAVDGQAQQFDWRGLPIKKHFRWNGTGYDEVS